MDHHAAPRTRVHLALLGVLAALALAACGSSGSGSSSSSSKATPAGSSGSRAGLAVATANVARYSKLPTALPVSTPLPSAPKRGKTVVFLQCEVAQCTQGGDGFRSAAAAIGWTTKTLGWQTTQPATLLSDMQRALAMRPKPYAVSISGLPQAIWAREIPAYARAGVLIIPWSLGPITYSKTVFANILSPASAEEQGRLLADWFIANSKGRGTVLLQTATEYPTIDEVGVGFQKEVSLHCPDCKLTTLNVSGPEIDANQVTSTIVSGLQRSPSIGYVMAADIALAPGLPEALHAAGRTVKVLGGAAISSDWPDIRNGAISASMETNQYFNGWQMIDVLARHAAGMPLSRDDGGGIQQILTSANAAAVGVADEVPRAYPSLFEKLWHVG